MSLCLETVCTTPVVLGCFKLICSDYEPQRGGFEHEKLLNSEQEKKCEKTPSFGSLSRVTDCSLPGVMFRRGTVMLGWVSIWRLRLKLFTLISDFFFTKFFLVTIHSLTLPDGISWTTST